CASVVPGSGGGLGDRATASRVSEQAGEDIGLDAYAESEAKAEDEGGGCVEARGGLELFGSLSQGRDWRLREGPPAGVLPGGEAFPGKVGEPAPGGIRIMGSEIPDPLHAQVARAATGPDPRDAPESWFLGLEPE